MTFSEADVEVFTTGLRSCLEQAVGLQPRDVGIISSLIKAGEWEVALETLCTQINEYDLPIGADCAGQLEELGSLLNVPVSDLMAD